MDLIPAIATATAGTAAAAMYLDARYNIGSDLGQLRGARGAANYVVKLQKELGDEDWSFYHVLHRTYNDNHHTDKIAVIFEDRQWTYRQLREDIGRVAEALQKLGVRNRSVVAMFINNSPEFLISWWALYKIGAIPAPINTAVTGDRFRHCLRTSESEALLISYELHETATRALSIHSGGESPWADELPHLKQVILYDYGGYPMAQTSLTGLVLMRHDDLPMAPSMADFPKAKRPKVGMQDAAQYLFTSGTTGTPKALIWPLGYCHMASMHKRWPYLHEKQRRFYVCLPMFHGTAAWAAFPATLGNSGTVTLARKFSRREFWADIRRTRSNAFLYIGEMVRYLVQAPPDPRFPDEKNHGVDLAYGLGMAPDVWRKLREKFNIPWVIEYYSASEATAILTNSNKGQLGIGKVARHGPLMRQFGNKTLYIVKADLDTEELIRDVRTGYCIKAKPGEVGEAICRIVPPLQRRHDYVGQEGPAATEKKTLRNVFETGDMFFRLGDALMMDEDGFYYFRDRLGDTYRAKGHNISTTEVETWLGRHPDVESVNVYAVPMNRYGYDGQLGCAAITLRESSSSGQPRSFEQQTLSQLERWLLSSEDALPSYAVPRFVRILVNNEVALEERERGAEIDSDGARVSIIMKKVKTGLRKDGFVLPDRSKDRMYWIEKEGAGYVPLIKGAVEKLIAGKAML